MSHEFSHKAGARIGLIPPWQVANTNDLKSRIRHERCGGAPGVQRAERVSFSPDEKGWMSNAAQFPRGDPHAGIGSPEARESPHKSEPRPPEVGKMAEAVEGLSLRLGPTLADLNWMSEKARKIASLGSTRRHHESDQSAADQRNAHEPHGERR